MTPTPASDASSSSPAPPRPALPRPARAVLGTATRTTAAGAGAVLGAGVRVLGAVRPAAKPLHPRGAVRRGRLVRTGAEDGTQSGVAWLDHRGEAEVLVRLSTGAGLPAPLPDVAGLALRVPEADGAGDLLLASTGWRGLRRLLLVGHRDATEHALTTLLPYRTAAGPVVLGARPTTTGEHATDGAHPAYDLSWATLRGPWHRFATLEVTGPATGDPGLDEDGDLVFDPVRHQLPGLAQYPAVRLLRHPGYRAAQASRDAGPA